jgi:hypothetical protein
VQTRSATCWPCCTSPRCSGARKLSRRPARGSAWSSTGHLRESSREVPREARSVSVCLTSLCLCLSDRQRRPPDCLPASQPACLPARLPACLPHPSSGLSVQLQHTREAPRKAGARESESCTRAHTHSRTACRRTRARSDVHKLMPCSLLHRRVIGPGPMPTRRLAVDLEAGGTARSRRVAGVCCWPVAAADSGWGRGACVRACVCVCACPCTGGRMAAGAVRVADAQVRPRRDPRRAGAASACAPRPCPAVILAAAAIRPPPGGSACAPGRGLVRCGAVVCEGRIMDGW